MSAPYPTPPEPRFWKYVDRRGPDDCWLWTGAADRGYGCLKRGGKKNGLVRAHRFSWEIHNGPISGGLSVLHRCDIPLCVNPAHLFVGTQADNIRDMVAKKRGPKCWPVLPGESNPAAKLTEADVLTIRRRTSGGERAALIARDFGVDRRTIGDIAAGRSWRHLAVPPKAVLP